MFRRLYPNFAIFDFQASTLIDFSAGIPTEQTLSDGKYRKLQLFELKCKDDPENYENLFKFCELALPYIEIESASHVSFKPFYFVFFSKLTFWKYLDMKDCF